MSGQRSSRSGTTVPTAFRERDQQVTTGPAAPAEELLSLVYFSDPDADALVRPVGQPDAEPVRCGPYLAAKLVAITSATAA